MLRTDLYWRAIRRVERRARTVRALRPMSDAPNHCPDCVRARRLLTEAVLLANRLATARLVA